MSSHLRSKLILSTLLIVLAAAAPLAAAAVRVRTNVVKDVAGTLDVSWTGNVITVTGATANGNVLLVGQIQSWRDYASLFTTRQRILVASATGDATFTLDGETAIPERSIWIAIDLQSGSYGDSAPSAAELRGFAIPETALQANESGQLNKVVSEQATVHMVLVRPATGVWELQAGDGSSADQDGLSDGKVEVVPSEMTAMTDTSSAAPDHYITGDVLLMIDPMNMSFSITRIGA